MGMMGVIVGVRGGTHWKQEQDRTYRQSCGEGRHSENWHVRGWNDTKHICQHSTNSGECDKAAKKMPESRVSQPGL